MSESSVAVTPNLEDALALGLTRAEYELVCAHQGGPPNRLELAMYSLLWSEHCAYKHSRKLLRTLPSDAPHVVMGPGENAGAVDVGGGLVCAFKVESHNHPSSVEPFQGAATGVGGILRDIFAVGARPIAVLDSLRFGEPFAARAPASQPAHADRPSERVSRSRYLLDGAVSGIAHYGNSVGVPTVGGELYFEEPYEQNCLINAMALGLAPHEKLVHSAASGTGNVLVLFGAATGRDGIGGASVLASAELGEADAPWADVSAGELEGAGGAGGESADKRPSVQVGDPFEEKKLLECSLELLERGLLRSLQDLGAAGLTSSAAEMAAKGGVGIDIDLATVPLREPGMEPFEVMVSESQERMLCVVAPGDLPDVLALCAKWEVNGTAIGALTDSGRIRVFSGERLVGDMPVAALVDACPLYDLAPVKPAGPIYPAPAATLSPEAGLEETLLALLGSPNIASRRPLFERYDAIVQSRTVRRPEEADAAVLRLPDGSALAVSIDGNGRRVAADPYRGTVAAVLECASNLACVGAEPLGITDNLNFANPEKPHIAWQLAESVRGLGDAARALGVPVVGGNVSLYNEGARGPIYPTPVIGMVGRLPDARRAGRSGFARAGETVALVGAFVPSLAGGELEKLRGIALPDGLAQIDLEAVRAAQGAVRDAARSGALSSAHDIAEGGLAIALAECCLAAGLGAEIELHDLAGELAAALFGEGSGGFLVGGEGAALRELARTVPVRPIGRVGGSALRIKVSAQRPTRGTSAEPAGLSLTLAQLARAHARLEELFL